MGLNDRVEKLERKAGGLRGCLHCRGAVLIKDVLDGEGTTPHRCPKCGLAGPVIILGHSAPRED
jgi:hypothetical protein